MNECTALKFRDWRNQEDWNGWYTLERDQDVSTHGLSP